VSSVREPAHRRRPAADGGSRGLLRM